MKQIARVVSLSQSFDSFADDDQAKATKKNFKVIFQRLIMAQGELDFAIDAIESAQEKHPETDFNNFFSSLFDGQVEKNT